VVVNGNAKNVTEEVISILDQILQGTDLFVSQSIQDAKSIAERLVERGYGTVLMGGGDGTFMVMVTEVVRAADRAGRPRPRFGYLKLGTGNALAHVVGATGQRRLAADIRRLKDEAGSRKIGLVEVDDLLAPFCGFGVDAEVLRDYKEVKEALGRTPLKRVAAGALSYFVSSLTKTAPSVLFRRMPHCRITNLGGEAFRLGGQGRVVGRPIARGEVVYEGPARIVAVSTIQYYGFGLRMFPYAEERSDRMSLRVSTLGPAAFAANLRSIWRGEYRDPSHLLDYLVDHARIEMDPATPFQIGGDVVDDRREVTVRLSNRPIRLVDFYAPPTAAR
jgi:diacylglycerol kinase family enzyme